MLINLIGCDGCGKSTQMKRLIPWLERTTGKSVRTVAKREVMQLDRFPQARYFGCSYQTLMYEILPEMQGESRALFLFNLFATQLSIEPITSKDVVLLDGGWIKHIATEMALGLPQKWLNDITACFPKPDVTLFLDVHPKTIVGWRRENSDSHAPYECGNQLDCSDEHFLSHMTKVYKNLLQLSEEQHWHHIPGEMSPDNVFTELCSTLSPFLSHSNG
ncbi:hypothetical protein RND59_19000 [Vibrio ruber]|uniref:dTMP kinase n=1 Tax=Vibrio ruber TaxID=184755 RepID=UPI00289353D9|nr:hypothetical protein [Vibrio ruber]WNJ97293.1 hypothetical protein RND59_19000 [Vibrio ruber]